MALPTIFEFKPSEVDESTKSAVELNPACVGHHVVVRRSGHHRGSRRPAQLGHDVLDKALVLIMRLVAKHMTNNKDKRAQIRADFWATRRLLPTFDTYARPLPSRVQVSKISSRLRR